MSKYYTGIGSRETPPAILVLMTRIAMKLEELGYILRSGGADGADTAFETGVKSSDNKEIFLPWNGFNKKWFGDCRAYKLAPPGAREIAEKIHPIFNSLKYGAQKLHERNVCQVLGYDLKTPSKFVICYTQDGANGKEFPCSRETGGTGTAIKLAAQHNIIVLNLKNIKDLENVKNKLNLC